MAARDLIKKSGRPGDKAHTTLRLQQARVAAMPSPPYSPLLHNIAYRSIGPMKACSILSSSHIRSVRPRPSNSTSPLEVRSVARSPV
ncbi:hypothetical protein [Ornithinimicrobium sp. INDO-MA30-4]|uniref:hypothetical protein n=1 Tax=Ornithinimicrobium sp. INDO-MA30-4 TaxID=2908651 RepID=UPI001F2375D6|nr:hypothetical protein [Ornithinimicrobium sp. INDO-MA30-4]UJH69981.1 hypothetical protein L0A91_12235 [Ornithinimicrobium sp. INDO-MA30-4]